MPVKTNITELLDGLTNFIEQVYFGTERGLQDAADLGQQIMQDTNAHGDVTGATRSSYRAYVIGGSHTGASESSSGYAAASNAIASYQGFGHGGQALSQDSGIQLDDSERGIIYTSYTDYQDKLETENAGQKAVIGPTVQQTLQTTTQLIADNIRNGL